MSLRTDAPDVVSTGLGRSETRLQAVLRTGAAKLDSDVLAYEPWVDPAVEQLRKERERVQELQRLLESSRVMRAIEKANASRKAAQCARKVDALEEKLQQRARALVRYIKDKGDFERDNKQILETIEDLERLCKGGDVYNGDAYEAFE